MRTKPQWVKDAEAAGLKWDDLDLFDKIQWQRRDPKGRQLLAIPMHVTQYGFLSDVSKKG